MTKFKTIICNALLYIPLVGILTILWLQYAFGSISLEQLFFNISQPMKGADLSFIKSFAVIVVAGSIMLMWLIKNCGRFYSKLKILETDKKYCALLIIGIWAAFVILAEKNLDVFRFVFSHFNYSDVYEKHYRVPEELKLPEQKKNLIVIYLESMETTYTNATIFKENLQPGLSRLAQENIAFNGFREAYGTNWTIAGFVGSLCGVPMKTVMYNNMSIFKSFLPNMVCVPELLQKQGYKNYFIHGGLLEFSGKDMFLRNHGFEVLWGKNELTEEYNLTAKDYGTSWGINDETLFEIAKEKVSKAAAQKEPFVFMIESVDTHFPYGYVSKSCAKKYGNFSDAVLCSDQLATDFVNWVKKQPFYKDTVIVLLGDHLAMKNIYYDKLLGQEKQRNIVNVIVNSESKPKKRERLFSILDMAPTIAEALGVKLENHQWGLGVSLLGDNKTLFEEYGDDINHELMKNSRIYEGFFEQIGLAETLKSVKVADKKDVFSDFTDYKLGTRICVNPEVSDCMPLRVYIGDGFSKLEAENAWTDSRVASLFFNIKNIRKPVLKFEAETEMFLSPRYPERKVKIYVNGKYITKWKFSSEEGKIVTRSFEFPAELVAENGDLVISFAIKSASTPLKEKVGTDDRKLGLNFKKLRIMQMEE